MAAAGGREDISEGRFLSDEQRRHFQEEGYLLLPDWWSQQASDLEIRGQVQRVVQEMDLDEARTIFSTDETKHAEDAYFLGSGDKIRFFWEPGAFDSKGEFVHDRFKSINKIGHALHDLDPVFKKFSYEKRVGQVSRDLGLSVPLAVQSMYIFKQPRIGGAVTPHQDGAFLYTEPQSVVGYWWALEDCMLSNGCLWAVPRSHTRVVRRRFKRSATGEGCEFEPAEGEAFDIEGAVPLEVKAGTLVLLHHSLVHYSKANTSDKSRHAYSIHVVEGKDGYKYPEDNWLQRPGDAPFHELP
ncbi:unnamed protein product [Laminaria digitata]